VKLYNVCRQNTKSNLTYTGDQVGQGGTVRAGDYILYMEKETEITNWEHDFLYTTE